MTLNFSTSTSSDVQQTSSSDLQASPTTPSPASTVETSPTSTHTPSATPVIAGSLVGVIVLVVCIVTLLLLAKRQKRLRAARILRAARYAADPTQFPLNPLDKRDAPNGYGVQAPPPTQDSAWTSGSSAASPHVPKLQSGHQHILHTSHPPNQPSRSYSSQSTPHHNNCDSQSFEPLQMPIHETGHSSSSSTQSQPASLSFSHAHSASTHIPRTQPQANISQMIPASSVPRGHAADVADVAAVDTNNIRLPTSERSNGPLVGVPAIVVTRDIQVQRVRQRESFDAGRQGDRGASGEPSFSTANGDASGNENEGGRSGIPETPGEYGHAQGYTQGGEEDYNDRRQQRGTSRSRMSALGSENSYPPPASTSGNVDLPNNGRMTDSDRLGLAPYYAGHDSYPRPRTASASTTSGSSLPSLLSLPGVPPSPTTSSIASSTRNSAGQNYTQQNSERTLNVVNNSTLSSPAVLPFTRQRQYRPYIGHAQAPIPLLQLRTGAETVEEEEAPPAYEKIWAPIREQDEQVRTERRGSEQNQEVRA